MPNGNRPETSTSWRRGRDELCCPAQHVLYSQFMTIYASEAHGTHQRTFRIFAGSSILILLAIGFFSIYEPPGLSHSTNVALAALAGVIVLGTVVVGLNLTYKETLWKFKHAFQWELTSEKLIQRHQDGSTGEIPLSRIESITEYHGWLVIRGGEPLRQIAVPPDVDGFEELKRALTSNCTVTPLKTKLPVLPFIPLVLWMAGYVLLFMSHILVVVIVAGCTALLLQGWSFYSLRRVWRAKSMSLLVVVTYILTCLMIAWIVFQRTKAAM
jgi:hypothetical protein